MQPKISSKEDENMRLNFRNLEFKILFSEEILTKLGDNMIDYADEVI
jgi:hypothetical protein